MKFKNLFFIVFCALSFTACQKGVEWTDDTVGEPGVPPGPTGELLIKSVAVSRGETITTIYAYDNNKRLISESTVGITAGIPMDSYRRFYRDSIGRIYRIAQLVKQTGIQMDTAFTHVYYPNETSFNFTHTVMEITASGLTVKDSAVYKYNGNDKVITQENYMINSFLPAPSTPTSKIDFIYEASNLIEQKLYSWMSGTGALVANYIYSYDDKVNPLNVSAEFILTGRTESASRNNMVNMELNDVTTPTNSRTISTSFVYGEGSKPTSATITEQPGNRVINYTFYYQ